MMDGHFDGMTLNERLFSAGLIEAFDAAARCRDRDAIVGILTKVAVEDAGSTADSILAARRCIGS